MNVQEAIDLFLDQCRHGRNLSQHTIRAYTIDLKEFTKYVGAAIEVEDCDKEKMRAYLAYLYERGLKETSIKRRMACLKAMWAWLEEEEYLEVNVFHRMRLRIKTPERLPKALTKREVSSLLAAPAKKLGMRGSQDYELLRAFDVRGRTFKNLTALVALELLFNTGMRVGELVRVRMSDIDLDDATIRVIGKGDRQRKVIIPDDMLHVLLTIYMEKRPCQKVPSDILLLTTQTYAATPQYIRRLVTECAESAKLGRRITPHMLRHTAATHYLEAGVDIRYVQALLGHQSISTTQIYAHVSDSSLKANIQGARIRKVIPI